MPQDRASRFPLGAGASIAELSGDPHPLLHRLREREPVSWLPALDGWLVTSHGLATEAMRDADRFTVDDERFSTARVLGPSMLSLDGATHERHRAPFVAPFRAAAVGQRFAGPVAKEADRLIDGVAVRGEAELRTEFAGPLAAAIVSLALGLRREDVPEVLALYRRIVGAVTEITAGTTDGEDGRDAYAALSAMLDRALRGEGGSLLAAAAASSGLSPAEIAANAAVLLFGGIETTEGMIANAVLHLLERPAVVAAVRTDPELIGAAIEESLRLEPAAAVIDRYATTDTALGGAEIAAGELVRLSIAAANRDPSVFADAGRVPPRPPRRPPAPRLRPGAACVRRRPPRTARGPRRARRSARAARWVGARRGATGRDHRTRVPQAGDALGALAALVAQAEEPAEHRESAQSESGLDRGEHAPGEQTAPKLRRQSLGDAMPAREGEPGGDRDEHRDAPRSANEIDPAGEPWRAPRDPPGDGPAGSEHGVRHDGAGDGEPPRPPGDGEARGTAGRAERPADEG